MKEKKYVLVPQVVVGILIIISLFWFLAKLRSSRVTVDSGAQFVMGTVARVVVVADERETANTAISDAMEEIKRIDDLMSDYQPDSEITKVNQKAHDAPVKVSKRTFEVLQNSIQFSHFTDGAFDITVGPMVDLWRDAQDANSVPSQEQLDDIKKRIGYKKLILDANEQTVRFAVEGMRLDLGAIAKGYAIDLAIQKIQEHSVDGAMVDIGGDIRCFGSAPNEKKRWVIGLQDPEKASEFEMNTSSSLILELTDQAVATSGDYRRFQNIGGKKYSHIYNTQTAASASEFSSVTIITSMATGADCFATAVTVMGSEKGLALVEKTIGAEAILITASPDYKLIKTSGADKFIIQQNR